MAEPPKIAGVVLRNQDGHYLLVREGQGPAYGLWNLAAGHVDQGETPQMAALRESSEETGYKVRLISDEPILVDDESEKNIKYAFSAEVIGGELAIPEEELLDAQWFALSDISKMYEAGTIRSPWVMNAVLKVENNENPGH